MLSGSASKKRVFLEIQYCYMLYQKYCKCFLLEKFLEYFSVWNCGEHSEIWGEVCGVTTSDSG